jgi:hypothetical protein
MAGFSRGARDSMGDLPENVLRTAKAMGIKPGELDYESLPDLDEAGDFTVVTQGGDEHVTQEGLIDMAHRDGLALTYTEPVQVPSSEHIRGVAENPEPVIFRAIVVTERGVFSAYGDANPDDTLVDAVIRMAETRALSRALRAAVNIGSATAPEMPASTDGVQVE